MTNLIEGKIVAVNDRTLEIEDRKEIFNKEHFLVRGLIDIDEIAYYILLIGSRRIS